MVREVPLEPKRARGVRLHNLISLGISGGALPCPTAVVILLASIHFKKVALGMLMILSFGVGLALVLIGIGILMVSAADFLNRFKGSGKLLKVLPVVSALVVSSIGGYLMVTTWQAREYYQKQAAPPAITQSPK